MRKIRLGVNIDHVATVRNARGGSHPDPVAAAVLALEAGADGITLHLREDRRHIRENDLHRLAAAIKAVLIDAIDRGGSYAARGRPRFRVYEREGQPCLAKGCRGTIKRITQMGRSTFFCPVCQK